MRLRIAVRACQDADGAAGVRRFAFTENSVGTDVVMVGILVIGLIGWTMDWTFHRVVARTLGRRFPEVAA